jgi:hypothetical protein
MGNVRRGKKGSDAARVSWRPRHRELPVYGGSTISKLMRCEIGELNGWTPPRPDVAFCAEEFRRFNLEVSFLAGHAATPWGCNANVRLNAGWLPNSLHHQV